MKNTGNLLIFIFTFLALTASAYASDDSPLHKAVGKGDKAEVEALQEYRENYRKLYPNGPPAGVGGNPAAQEFILGGKG
jgi:hypothetical protein